MAATHGSDRKNEKDERKKDVPRNPGSNPGSRHEEKAPGRNPAPTRPGNEPRKDRPEEGNESEDNIERGSPDRYER